MDPAPYAVPSNPGRSPPWGSLAFQRPPKTRPKNKPDKIHTNLQKCTLGSKYFNFNVFLMPFGPPYLINFCDHLNLLNCNKYNATPFF